LVDEAWRLSKQRQAEKLLADCQGDSKAAADIFLENFLQGHEGDGGEVVSPRGAP